MRGTDELSLLTYSFLIYFLIFLQFSKWQSANINKTIYGQQRRSTEKREANSLDFFRSQTQTSQAFDVTILIYCMYGIQISLL